MQKHFITSLGTGNYKETTYSYNNESYKTAYAPVAVAKIKKLTGAKATVLVTAEAQEKHYDNLAAELKEIGLHPSPLLVPEGKNEEEFLKIFSQITENVIEKENIVLDVTFGLRHLPFIYFQCDRFKTFAFEANSFQH